MNKAQTLLYSVGKYTKSKSVYSLIKSHVKSNKKDKEIIDLVMGAYPDTPLKLLNTMIKTARK